MSRPKRKPRVALAENELHPVVPPGSAATVEQRLRQVEEMLGLQHRVFVIDPEHPGPFTKEKRGPNDLVVRLRRFDEPEPPPAPAVDVGCARGDSMKLSDFHIPGPRPD